jgi:hypothetical protein
MKLSNETVGVLKNFSSINPNLVVREGNTVKTISEAKNIVASAELSETFPAEFGVYDLNEFLSVLGLIEDPELTFADDAVEIAQGRSKVRYRFSEIDILTAPQKDVNMPAADVSINLDGDTIAKVKRAASVMGHSDIAITGEDGKIDISVVDTRDSSANTFAITLDDNNECKTNFKFIMNIGNLKILPGDYELDISSKLITNFRNKDLPIQYWIALEKNSTFGG